MKPIHAKARFTEDIRYLRSMLREIESAVKSSDWSTLADIAMECEGLMSSMRAYADDNRYGIEQSHCLPQWEIDEIIAARAEAVAK